MSHLPKFAIIYVCVQRIECISIINLTVPGISGDGLDTLATARCGGAATLGGTTVAITVLIAGVGAGGGVGFGVVERRKGTEELAEVA